MLLICSCLYSIYAHDGPATQGHEGIEHKSNTISAYTSGYGNPELELMVGHICFLVAHIAIYEMRSNEVWYPR